jgi:multidrug efflux pump
LLVVPMFYAVIAPYTRSPEALARKLDQLDRDTPVGAA